MSLKETNSYLQNPKKYQEALLANALSSTAIETGNNIMKLDIKKPAAEYEIKKEEGNMVDVPIQEEQALDNPFVPIFVNASVDIELSLKKGKRDNKN